MDLFHGLIQFFQENKNHKQKPVFESDFAVYALNGYSLRTEKTYIQWIWCFIRFHGLKHPDQIGADDVIRFLEHLAADRHVASNTPCIALNALVFCMTNSLNVHWGRWISAWPINLAGYRRYSRAFSII
jgi:hypothetical protein